MKTPFLQLTYQFEEIDNAVVHFWEKAHLYKIFAFSGDMGAGKTTFIHKLCDYLGVTDTVSSPTFALINEYHFNDRSGTDNTIYHMDWYRLLNAGEAIEAGMEDCIAQATLKNTYCFVEWPERANELLIIPYVLVRITSKDITEREMTVTLMQ